MPIDAFATRLLDAIYWPLPLTLWPVPAAVPFWLVFFWARIGEKRALSGQRAKTESSADFDKGSWLVISQGWRLVRIATLLCALFTPPWFEGSARYAVYAVGLIFMVLGALLRQHCFRMLGRQFTYEVQVEQQDGIIKSGIYKWVRHPSYTGGMTYNLGVALALTNWLSLVLTIVGMVVMYLYRVRVEEQALLEIHGDKYREYMRHTKRFIPFIF